MGASRTEAISRLREALAGTVVDGVKTNVPFVQKVLSSPEFTEGDVHTGLGSEVLARARTEAVAEVAA